MAQEWSEDQLKWYDKVGKARPTHIAHGVNSEDLGEHMKELRPNSWRLEGNTLIGETDFGPLVQYIDPKYILVGTTKEGLPQFKEVSLQ